MGARSRGSTLTTRGKAPDGTRAGLVRTLDNPAAVQRAAWPRGSAVGFHFAAESIPRTRRSRGRGRRCVAHYRKGDSKNFLGLLGTDRPLHPTNGQVVVEFAQMNTWVYRAVGTALLILAVVGLGNLIRFFGSSHPKPLDDHSVATGWNESVERMGINPIYPPQSLTRYLCP